MHDLDPNESSHTGEASAHGQDEAPLAAVDLGSNSFHMVVGREIAGRFEPLDSMRERVAMADALGAEGAEYALVKGRALACLERFGQRLVDLPGDRVRAVGTATLRSMPGRAQFIQDAEKVLGHEIEILSGREEARVIYLGVAHSLGDDLRRRLVLDIGGASTEIILGSRFEAQMVDSLSMGCLIWSKRFFPKGRLARRTMADAELAARLEFQPIEMIYGAAERDAGNWDECIGSSGTALAIEKVVVGMGWSKSGITRDSLEQLLEAIIACGSMEELDFEGLRADRKPVFAGGVAIMRAAFIALGIDRMRTSKGALREGLMYDLLGRMHHEDVRERTVELFAKRYHVDELQAARVQETALGFFDSLAAERGLGPADRRLLRWATRLHEVGLNVSWRGYQKHGAYLLSNSHLPGFSRDERLALATLVLAQRRKVQPEMFAGLNKRRQERLRDLALLLRLAVLLRRGRRDVALPRIALEHGGAQWSLAVAAEWMELNPLSRADLDVERALLRALDIVLVVEET